MASMMFHPGLRQSGSFPGVTCMFEGKSWFMSIAPTMKPSTRRLIKEYTVWLKEPIEGVYIKPDPFNILLWRGVFEGPKGTPYEDGVYHFEIEFPTDYPFKMYKLTVTTKIHHINVDAKGTIWILDRDQWSPALTAKHGVRILTNLIAEPDDNLAMSQSIYDEWAENRAAFDQKARQMRDQYASGYISDYRHWHDEDPYWTANYLPVPDAAPSPSAASTSTPTFSFGPASTAFSFSSTPSTGTTPAPSFVFPSLSSQNQSQDLKLRLRSEYQDLLTHPVKNVVAAPSPENPLLWTGVIDELYGTRYENELFKFEIVFSTANTEPMIRLTSPISQRSLPTLLSGSSPLCQEDGIQTVPFQICCAAW